MAGQSVSSDVGVGVGILLSVLAVVAAALTAVVSPEAMITGDFRLSALGFGAAMFVGIVAVAAIHLFWSE
jgi:hypothetical protein